MPRARHASGRASPPLPPWISKRLPARPDPRVRTCLQDLGLNTVCAGARCPNLCECYQQGQATFLLMGPNCTRRCRFCAVSPARPAALDPEEPERVARAVERLRLAHAVITSVTRDDLADGGAGHFRRTVEAVRRLNPGVTVEVLVPDFGGERRAWAVAVDSGADVFNHNLETVPRLYRRVRPQADYGRSLALLAFAKERRPGLLTKSGLMLGLGECEEEVLAAAADLRGSGVDMITVGQYLCPGRERNLPVTRFVAPAEFEQLAERLRGMGFAAVACAPFVRSSYHAGEALAHAREATLAARREQT